MDKREKANARHKRWRERNKAKVSAKSRAYYQAKKANWIPQPGRPTITHPFKGKFRWAQLRSKCKRGGIPFDLPVEFFESVPSHCPQCTAAFLPVGSGRRAVASVDRDDPALGYVVGNCEWICGACNMRKQDQSWSELLAFAVKGMLRKICR